MGHLYSLVHLTNLKCSPPQFIHTASRAGYDAVSLRTIPLGLPGERPYDLARDPQLLRETKQALAETGLRFGDTEIARIADGVEVRDYEPALAAAAELGVSQVTSNIWTADRGRYTEQFAQLCQLAAKYGLFVNVEFVTWASVSDLRQTRELILSSGAKNAGILVDMLHFYRSHVSLEELDLCPREWFRVIHLCDCPREIPAQEEALAAFARTGRLLPGEGAVPIREILAHISAPDAILGLEVPHARRLEQLGFETYARTALVRARACIGEKKDI